MNIINRVENHKKVKKTSAKMMAIAYNYSCWFLSQGGKANDCKSFIDGSTPPGTSK